MGHEHGVSEFSLRVVPFMLFKVGHAIQELDIVYLVGYYCF